MGEIEMISFQLADGAYYYLFVFGFLIWNYSFRSLSYGLQMKQTVFVSIDILNKGWQRTVIQCTCWLTLIMIYAKTHERMMKRWVWIRSKMQRHTWFNGAIAKTSSSWHACAMMYFQAVVVADQSHYCFRSSLNQSYENRNTAIFYSGIDSEMWTDFCIGR